MLKVRVSKLTRRQFVFHCGKLKLGGSPSVRSLTLYTT